MSLPDNPFAICGDSSLDCIKIIVLMNHCPCRNSPDFSNVTATNGRFSGNRRISASRFWIGLISVRKRHKYSMRISKKGSLWRTEHSKTDTTKMLLLSTRIISQNKIKSNVIFHFIKSSLSLK